MTDLDIGFFADLTATLGGLRDQIKADRDWRDKNRRAAAFAEIPVDRPLLSMGAFPTSGIVAFDLGGPDLGRIWLVRRIAVGGITPTTTAAGRADVFVSAIPPVDPVTGGTGGGGTLTGTALRAGVTAEWRDQATTLPLAAQYSNRQIVVNPNESLWIVISSGTVSQQYVVNAGVEEYMLSAAKQSYEL